MFTESPVAYDFACSSGRDSRIVSVRFQARIALQAKNVITAAPRRAIKGTYGSMPAIVDRARIDRARKTVSFVLAPAPSLTFARLKRFTLGEAMSALTGPGG